MQQPCKDGIHAFNGASASSGSRHGDSTTVDRPASAFDDTATDYGGREFV